TCMKQGCQDPPGFINLSSRYGSRVIDADHWRTLSAHSRIIAMSNHVAGLDEK
ncbi:hypothetical protein CEP51_014973, partial [Fusarium floridanum]